LIGAADIAGRREAARPAGVDVLFAFDDEHVRRRVNEALEPVWNQAHALEIPNPSTVYVGPSPAEALWLIPDGLVEERGVFIVVRIRAGNPLRLLDGAGRRLLWRRLVAVAAE
jgi:hypothetical protein